jgi:hypothetical protein
MTVPLKVDEHADAVATHSAHFLGMTKKQFVSEAIAAYSEARRVEIENGVRAALATLDGTRATAVGHLSGLSADRIEELGGLG